MYRDIVLTVLALLAILLMVIMARQMIRSADKKAIAEWGEAKKGTVTNVSEPFKAQYEDPQVIVTVTYGEDLTCNLHLMALTAPKLNDTCYIWRSNRTGKYIGNTTPELPLADLTDWLKALTTFGSIFGIVVILLMVAGIWID